MQMIHYMLLLGYILCTCHKNNIVTLHVTFMLYRRNKTCLLGRVIASGEFQELIGTFIPYTGSVLCEESICYLST